MGLENIGDKMLLFVFKTKLRSLRIFQIGHEIDEVHLMDIIASDSDWPLNGIYESDRFYNVESVARYEMTTRKPGWEWRSIPGSCGLCLWNEALWKQTRQNKIKAVIIRTGDTEWRVYRVKTNGKN